MINEFNLELKNGTELGISAACCRRFRAPLRRHRQLIFLFCMVLGFIIIRHLMGVIPRVLRRRRNRRIKLVVPFPVDGDAFFQMFTITVQPLSNSDNTTESQRRAEWEWYCYSSQNTSTPRILLAQYAGPHAPGAHYSELLQCTSPVNRAYAKWWGMDYVILTGIALNDHHVIPSHYFQARHSSYNKLELLRQALKLQQQYDWLWILDADALVYNFSTPLVSILPSNATESLFLMAHKVLTQDSVHTWHINNGVTLWNLHHPTTTEVLLDWTRHSLNRIAANAQLQEINPPLCARGRVRSGNSAPSLAKSRYAWHLRRRAVANEGCETRPSRR